MACQNDCNPPTASQIVPLVTYLKGVNATGCEVFTPYPSIPASHPSATLTNNNAPFSWDVTNQTGNIPQPGKLVANPDGSYTFTPGDGSPAVTIPKDCCPTMSQSGNTITFTNGNGSTVVFDIHPAATLTNTAAPFSWNSATQSGNVPAVSASVSGNTLTINVGGTVTTFTATSGVSADGGNILIVGSDGKPYIDCEAIQDCVGQAIAAGLGITYDDAMNAINSYLSGLTFTDSATIDFTVSPSAPNMGVTADVKISTTAGNATVANADGIYTPNVCTQINAFGAATASVAGDEFLATNGGACKRVTLPSSPAITANNTSTVTLTATGTLNHTVQADVNIGSTAGNSLSVSGGGLYAPNVCTQLSALSAATPSVSGDEFLAVNGGTCKRVTIAAFVETPLTANDSATVDFTTSGTSNHTLTADVKLSATAGNQITANADGLYVAKGAGVTVTDSTSVDLTESGGDITAVVIASPTSGNALTLTANGVYVPNVCTQLLSTATGSYAYTDTLLATDGTACKRVTLFATPTATDCAGTPEVVAWTQSGWKPMQYKRIVASSAGGTYTPSGTAVLLKATGNVTVADPTNCGYAFVTVKNFSTSSITLTANMDGSSKSITLAGANSFGTGLGASIDLEWDGTTYVAH